MSLFDAVEAWAAVLRRVAVQHPQHGIHAFHEVWTYNPSAGAVPPCALVVGVEPVSDNAGGLASFSEFDLVTQILMDRAEGGAGLDRGQQLWPVYWDAIKTQALSDFTLGGTVTRQSFVGRAPTPAIFEHNGQQYVAAEFALRVTVVTEGAAALS